MTRLSMVVVVTIVVWTITVAAGVIQPQEQSSVLRLDSSLESIVAADAKLEKLSDSPGPGSREGPLWVQKAGYLLYSDMTAKAINKWNPLDGAVSIFMADSNSNGLTVDRQDRIVFAARAAIVRLENNGQRSTLVDNYQGKPLVAPNDLVYKSDGALYFTDPNSPTAATPYIYLLRRGKLQLFIEDMMFPNGLAFSPDERYLYVNDMMKKTIVRFDVLANDAITNGRLFIDEDPDRTNPYPGNGYPDGMKVDRKGNIYCTGPGGVWVISPDGKHLGTILVPTHTVNIAFGESDGKTLFITSRPGLYRIRLKNSGIRP